MHRETYFTADFDTAGKPYQVSAGWSSLVARRAHNPKVVGSNPAPATNYNENASLDGRGVEQPGSSSGS